MSITIKQVTPWDGTSGTGADVRKIINDNFAAVKEAIEDIGGSPGSSSSHTASLTPPTAAADNSEWFSTKSGVKFTKINGQFIES